MRTSGVASASDRSTDLPEHSAAFELAGIAKAFGPTQALKSVDLTARPGEVIGLVGHNGAGKSTLMRVLTGQVRPDAGTLGLGGTACGTDFAPRAARQRGVRIVEQELSLHPNLRVLENLLVRYPGALGWRWRRAATEAAQNALAAVFPGSRITVRTRVGDLPLGQQQMVEIALAVADVGPPMRLLVLDEPTASLDGPTADQLFAFLRSPRMEGVCTLLVSHRLREISQNVDRVVVLRDGQVVHQASPGELDRDALIRLMGDGTDPDQADSTQQDARANDGEPFLIDLPAAPGRQITVRRGEVVGLSGLDGQGQREILHAAFAASRRGPRKASFVSGDRGGEGVMPLWSVRQNVSLSSLRTLSRRGLVNPAAESGLAEDWIRRLDIRGNVNGLIGNLSGGNQQKALVARALAAESDLVLLDDPTRGVDISTRHQIYDLVHAEAARGRAVLWYSTETDEIRQCHRSYVIQAGQVVDELERHEFSEERLLLASFAEKTPSETAEDEGGEVS
ncbi:sugar ABC transporter ATP-binding protein [Dactylosporangium sp. NPDC051484]|uniref:sugar ABC transporter ATP-binding protein n=1 Tax=Dactylosporangium sp. NPDC051484 TaxID=3154942 RepID=UPI00344DDFBA